MSLTFRSVVLLGPRARFALVGISQSATVGDLFSMGGPTGSEPQLPLAQPSVRETQTPHRDKVSPVGESIYIALLLFDNVDFINNGQLNTWIVDFARPRYPSSFILVFVLRKLEVELRLAIIRHDSNGVRVVYNKFTLQRHPEDTISRSTNGKCAKTFCFYVIPMYEIKFKIIR